MPKNSFKKLCVIIDGPQFVVPWLDRFYESTEIEMLLAMEQEWKPIAFFKDRCSMDIEAVERSYVRGVLEKDDNGNVVVT